ncbi:copper amine oxidase N-terminal domain-containing protein [Saccharibacillus sacchari]|uniref:copper amine oxidase N-terminal domain-containing protein n=1 Tax=Saccharibacillus sacchari TaxID=456493 RepID=UPI000568B757|nr:copper amine oxidase N-terminal domain-containing protein [Saccharibacillus sacchari]
MRRIFGLVSIFLLLGSSSIWSMQTYAAHPAWDNQENEPPIGLVEPAYSLIDRYEHSEKVHLRINGDTFYSELKPVKVYETVMVPARDLFKKINMKIQFDQQSLALTASKSNTTLKFSLKSSIATANGKESVLPRIPFREQTSNRMFVPLRYTVESLGGTVKWDNKQKTAYVTLAK